jgi:hypothetical protein
MRGNRRQNNDVFDRSSILLIIGAIMLVRMYIGGSTPAQEKYEAEIRSEEALIDDQYEKIHRYCRESTV